MGFVGSAQMGKFDRLFDELLSLILISGLQCFQGCSGNYARIASL